MIRNALVAGLMICASFMLQNSAWNPYARATELDLVSIVKHASVNLNDNCSGVVIDSERVLTAAHCVQMYPKETKLKVNVNGKVFLGYWQRFEANIDLAIVYVPHANLKNPIKVATSEPEIGSDIYCIGNPFGALPDTLTKGILGNKFRKSYDTKAPRWQYDCAIHRGNSGGVVLNAAGELIAITVEGIIAPQQAGTNFVFGVPLPEIKEFIAKPAKADCIVMSEGEFRAMNAHLKPVLYRATGEALTKLLAALNVDRIKAEMFPFEAEFILIGTFKKDGKDLVGFALFDGGCLLPTGSNTMLRADWDAFIKGAGIEWKEFEKEVSA